LTLPPLLLLLLVKSLLAPLMMPALLLLRSAHEIMTKRVLLVHGVMVAAKR
jgi:hypothetical protein